MSQHSPEMQASFVSRIATWSARHRRLVALTWLVLVIGAFGTCALMPANTNLEQEAPGESGRAFELYKDRFGTSNEKTTEIVVFLHPSLKVDDPAYRSEVEGVMATLRGLRAENRRTSAGTTVLSSTRIVGSTLTHYDIGAQSDRSPFVAQNATGGGVTFALVELTGTFEDAEDNVDKLVDAVDDAQKSSNGFTILEGGDASTQKQATDVTKEDFSRALLLNLGVTAVILILAFGAVVAASVPLTLALVAIIVASALLSFISRAYALSEIYTEIVLLMGLATGIDYSLFVISRYRRERGAGAGKEDALATAMATSGKAVFFAGVTVLLAISGMFLVGDSIFTSLGIAAVVVVAMAIIIAVTLLPAMVALLGDNVDRLTIPFLNRGSQGEGVWSLISDRVLARPAVLAMVTLVALIAISAPILTLNLGFNGAKGLSDDVEAKKALRMLEDNFTLGLIAPAMVIVDAGKEKNVLAPEVQSHVAQLIGDPTKGTEGLVQAETVSSDRPDAFYGAPIQNDINNAGDTEVIEIPINGDTGDSGAIDAVKHLRKDLVPGAFEDSSARVLVTGSTAANIDFRDKILSRTPIVYTFVLGLAFLVMLITFRSLVIAIKAVILNALSVGAAYGLLVLVFQRGWLLTGILNFEATGIIESWLPLFLFSILFGLSMDYHLFIMGRIKEAHERGMSNDEAISTGVKATAGTITNAAMIMIAVAVIFAFMRDIGIKQFGFGLAAAILIDATVIRSILLPASMKLLGEANWYLPSWLRWLPEIKMAE